MFQKLCEKHKGVVNDLNIGYPISQESLNEMWELMHNLHLIKYSDVDPYSVMRILERYEYM